MAGPRDPSNPFGIRDPATLEQWQQQFGIQPAAAPPAMDPDSPEAWEAAAAAAGAPGGVRTTPGKGGTFISASNSRVPSAEGHDDSPPMIGNAPGAGSNAAVKPTSEDERFGDDDEAQRRARARRLEKDVGMSPEDARRQAGVQTQPGELDVPDDPRKTATNLTPEDQWLPKNAAGGLHMVSPGGRRAHSWTTQEGLALPGAVKAYGIADESARDAAGAGRNAGIAEAEREVAYLDRFEKAQERRALDAQWKAEDRARRLDAETDKLAEMTDLVRNDKIDNTQFFTGHGIAGGFAAAIAYTLGAVGGAMTHTENPVVGIIGAEIQTQKDNAAMRKGKLEEQKGLLGQLAKTFGDERVAEDAAWVLYLEKSKTAMARIAADSKSDWVQARYKQAVAGIDAELAPRIQSLETAMQDKVVRQDVNAPPTFIGGGAGAKSENADPLFVPTGPNGEGFKARSEKEAQAARGVIAAEQDVIPMLERLKELRRKTNWAERRYAGTYETEDMSRIKSLQSQVALGLRDLSATSPGAMDAGMQKLAGEIQGDWTSTQGNPEAAADEFIATIRRKKDSMMRGQGAQAQRQGLRVDARGNVATGTQGQARIAGPKPATPASFKRAK